MSPVTALALDGVVYRSLVPAAAIELAVAYRTERSEPHLMRTVEVTRQIF